MSNILNATDPGHIDSDTELHSPTSANAVTRGQAAAQNTSVQSEPTAPLQTPGPSASTAEEEADYNLYRQLKEEEAPSDQQWLQSTEELEKTLKGMLGANFLAASTTADQEYIRKPICLVFLEVF